MTYDASRDKTDVIHPVRRHIVVTVDDDPGVLSALQRVFRSDPHDFLVTESPTQVLDWIAGEDVSLVISDQRMPEITGIEMLREVRKRSPRTQCVILTAFPSQELAREAEELGIHTLITKPWDDAQLRRIVRQLLRAVEWDE